MILGSFVIVYRRNCDDWQVNFRRNAITKTGAGNQRGSSWDNLPPGRIDDGRGGVFLREGDSRTFRTQQEAENWIRSLRCGGSVSNSSKIVVEILPG